MADAWGGSFGVAWGASWGSGVTPPTPTPGRSGLGGDDIPRRSPHRGWDREEWQRLRKRPDDELEATLRAAYAELTGETAAISVLARVDEITRPVAKITKIADYPLVIDWKALSANFERASALHRLWREEQDLQAAMEDDDEAWLLLT